MRSVAQVSDAPIGRTSGTPDMGCRSPAADPQPILGVKSHAGNFLHAEPSFLTLLGDPRQRMPNHARRVGFMAGSDPAIAQVIITRMLRREVGGEKNPGRRRISQKAPESGFNLR